MSGVDLEALPEDGVEVGQDANASGDFGATKATERLKAMKSINLKIDRSRLRDFLFRGLMFEAEAEQFRSAGIRIGADAAVEERSLLEETLDPFSIDVRNEALQMGRIYALIYC